MKFKVRDLGAVMPWKITDSRLILGLVVHAGGDIVDVVLHPDGTIVTLPSGIGRALDINDSGLVLCRDINFGPTTWLFNSSTGATETFSMPGFRYLWPEKINNCGDVVGSVAKQPDHGDRRGFIRHRKSGSITWVSPKIGPGPAGSVLFLYLNAINDLGHAVGTEGWEGSTRAEVPIYYDGTVHQIGNPTYMAEGDLITSNDRIRVSFTQQGSSESRAIYDRATNQLTPFVYGFIYDMNASGMILSQESGDYFLRVGGISYPLAPSMGGWSNIYARSINKDGLIAGYGETAGARHGFVLEYDPVGSAVVPDIAAKILWGIINDAGGIELVGGVLRHVPPDEPVTGILRTLPQDLAAELAAIVDEVPLNGPINVQTFSDRASLAVTCYRRKLLRRSADGGTLGSSC